MFSQWIHIHWANLGPGPWARLVNLYRCRVMSLWVEFNTPLTLPGNASKMMAKHLQCHQKWVQNGALTIKLWVVYDCFTNISGRLLSLASWESFTMIQAFQWSSAVTCCGFPADQAVAADGSSFTGPLATKPVAGRGVRSTFTSMALESWKRVDTFHSSW